jgi:hypothetical protein
MTKTLFVLPAAKHSTLSCVWIDTGNPALPLACVWIDRDLHIAGTDANISSETSESASTMGGIAGRRLWADQSAERQKP